MIGKVVAIYPEYATLEIPGCSSGIRAHFSEIENSIPPVLDFAESVSCTVFRDRDCVRAKEVHILVGKSERRALGKLYARSESRAKNNGETWLWRDDKWSGKPKHRGGRR
jgi:hypothetical protein